MGSFPRVGLVLSLMTFLAVVVAEAQEGLTKRHSQGPVTVAVTLTAAPAVGEPVKVKVVLDTHSVGLDGIEFDRAVAIRTSDGADLAPTAIERAAGSGHHREAVLVFPPVASAGTLKIVVKDVGGVAERNFVWDLQPAR